MHFDALLVTDAQSEQIAIVNAQMTDRQLVPVLDKDGRKVLPADLLTDIGTQEAQGWWYDYGFLLLLMERETVELPDPSPEP